jgi:hypothetical protein
MPRTYSKHIAGNRALRHGPIGLLFTRRTPDPPVEDRLYLEDLGNGADRQEYDIGNKDRQDDVRPVAIEKTIDPR